VIREGSAALVVVVEIIASINDVAWFRVQVRV
jgi:hypothetical protein